MRLFAFQPGEIQLSEYDNGFSIYHIDLDHVVSMRDGHHDNGDPYWAVGISNNIHLLHITKACFERMRVAWESK